MAEGKNQFKLLKFLGMILLFALLSFVFLFNYNQRIKDYQLPPFIESLRIHGEKSLVDISDLPSNIRIELISLLKVIKNSKSSFDLIGGFKKPLKVDLVKGSSIYEVSDDSIKMGLALFLVEDQAKIALIKAFLKQHLGKPLDSQFLLTIFSDFIHLYQENKLQIKQVHASTVIDFSSLKPWLAELAPIEEVCRVHLYPLEYVNFCDSINKLADENGSNSITNTWSLLSLRRYVGSLFLEYLGLWSWSKQPEIVKSLIQKLDRYDKDLVQYELPNEKIYSDKEAQALIDDLVLHFFDIDMSESLTADRSRKLYQKIRASSTKRNFLVDLGSDFELLKSDEARNSFAQLLEESNRLAFIRQGDLIEVFPSGSKMKLVIEDSDIQYHIYDSCEWPSTEELIARKIEGEFFVWVKQCTTDQFVEFRAFRTNDILFSFSKRNPRLDFLFFDSKLLNQALVANRKPLVLKFFLKVDSMALSPLDVKLGFKSLVWYPSLSFFYSNNPGTAVRGVRNGSTPALPSFQKQ